MHGELPKQIWAKTKGRTRRNLAVVLIVVAVAAALVYVFAKSPPQQNRSRFGAEGGPVPVLAAAAATATTISTTARLRRVRPLVFAQICFGSSPCIGGLQRLRQPAAAERLIKTDDRQHMREPRLHQRVLGLIKGLLRLQHGDQIDGALVQALLGNIEGAPRTGHHVALQPLTQRGLPDGVERVLHVGESRDHRLAVNPVSYTHLT